MNETAALAGHLTPASRRTLTMLVSLLMAVTVVVGFHPRPAHANAYECPTGAVCMWRGAYATGHMAFWRPSTIGTGVRLNSEFRRDVSSMWNRTGGWVEVFGALNCPEFTTTQSFLPAGQYRADLSSWRYDNGLIMDNSIGSMVIPNGRQRPC